ncbi:hypothetical protein Barb4_03561 [Bacteroidales bacterium Barb4]|nr:hypothetical protein Barb4_03561 [Bacteroidales bacterium Barb4]
MQLLPQSVVRPDGVEGGVGFENVEMGVHRLGGYTFTVVAVAFGRLPVTGEGFGVTVVGGVKGVFLQCAVQGDGRLEAFHIARCAEVGGKSVDAKSNAVGLLVGIVG